MTSQSQPELLYVSSQSRASLWDLKKLSKMYVVGVSNDIWSTIIAVFSCGVMTWGSVKVMDNE